MSEIACGKERGRTVRNSMWEREGGALLEIAYVKKREVMWKWEKGKQWLLEWDVEKRERERTVKSCMWEGERGAHCYK